ncbi:FAD-dependent oxidoreductase [Dictyobacter alpinus]|uniref:FAD-dependent oxidoreductase n=1 Tax=Dictyobacter alpinus TaxID=2014873 RepID=UPI000F83C207|nr:FAD-dependent monooxygenase [Dictyobacter alpinus]
MTAPWAVGCDGASSQIRKWLEIEQVWQDYGTYSAVMECGLPQTISRIVLEPSQPYGFFYFSAGCWRMIYRINQDEDRHRMVQEEAVLSLIKTSLPHAVVHRFLWASAFRLGQGQCTTYHKDHWMLAGDAAHAMGPSAGAGMMVGLLGVWRLGWRLALLKQSRSVRESLLQDYTREQQAASRAVQQSNALIFRNLAVTNVSLATLRSGFLWMAGHIGAFSRQLVRSETLVEQVIPIAHAQDILKTRNWETRTRLGRWQVGHRLPYLRLADQKTTLDLPHLKHLLFPIGMAQQEEEDDLARQIIEQASVPVERLQVSEEVSSSWRVYTSGFIAFALVRPDQHVICILCRKHGGK